MYYNIKDNKEENWKDNKGKYGVYGWINTLTASFYVGSSTVLNRRIKCYLETNYLPPPASLRGGGGKHINISLLYTKLY